MEPSKSNVDYIWVACSDGMVHYVDWTRASEPSKSFQTLSQTARDITVIPTGISGGSSEAVVVLESGKSFRAEAVVYVQTSGQGTESKSLLTLKKNGNGLQILKASDDGRILVGAHHDRLFIGVASHDSPASLNDLAYEFFSYDTPDLISTIDFKTSTKPSSGVSNQKSKVENGPEVDIVVGGARGAIYLYQDAVNHLQAFAKSKSDKNQLQARKLHWHRRAVHAVKWSRDGRSSSNAKLIISANLATGNYLISGGSENVLVMWQMDTFKKEFLPHLSGSIENITVSTRGSSYVVHLDDNSTMILSTAELKPTAYVSGIQSAAVSLSSPKDLLVQRTWTSPDSVRRPIPAVVRPSHPSKIHVCVGNGRQAAMSGDFSAPLLQSFDLETFTSVNKQPLARTQPTDVNITSRGNPIEEPLITHLAFSHDGKWLASVDEWQPSERDAENISADLRDQVIRERHEVFLKFWDMETKDETAALVSRVNSPHATTKPERVLDVASNPCSTCFASIGSDGTVRLWQPKLRQNSGVTVKGAEDPEIYSWSCSQVIPIGDAFGQDAAVDLVHSDRESLPQGSIAFSEDGSTIFAAFGGFDAGVVYVIDASSGEVVKTLEGLWTGQLQSIKVLSPFLVILSSELRVYDIVGDELRYGIAIPNIPGVSELLQLAVDHQSGHFAVALPVGDVSSVGVFDPEEPEPLLVRSVPHRIVSLLTSPDSSGFIALDDSAQVWTIAEESNPSSLAAIQPLEELRLDGPTQTQVAGEGIRALLTQGEDSDVDVDEDEAGRDEDVEMEDDLDDEVHPSVLAPELLADIFDAAPAFAGPSVEDMFYKVTDLLVAKPLVAASE